MEVISMPWTILTTPISSITTAFPREDRVYFLGNSTDRTPKETSKETISVRFGEPKCGQFFFRWRQSNTNLIQKVLVLMSWWRTKCLLTMRMVATVIQVPENHSHRARRRSSQNIHNNWTPEQGGILEGSSSQPCPTRGSRQRATRVRVSSMCSQRTSSKT